MNAVICLRSFPPTIFDGVRAMTTSTPAFTPLVHQSFSPFRTNSLPSELGSARRLIVAGSDPACVSVNANAEISPPATRGRYFCFCSSVPNKRSGWATPIEIVATNKKVAGETAAVLERIARGFRQFERFPLPFRHLRRVDNAGSRLFWFATGLRAGFLSDLFFGRFERGFHIIRLSFRAESRNLWI